MSKDRAASVIMVKGQAEQADMQTITKVRKYKRSLLN
jgi:hypothetical protein